jgi:hypothetical protein
VFVIVLMIMLSKIYYQRSYASSYTEKFQIVMCYYPLASTGVAWADGSSSSGNKCLSNST